MLLSELPGMLREHPGQRGGLRPGCARAGWREVGAGSPPGWLLLMFNGSWFPPPPVATHGAWHLLITSSRTCADLINSVPASAPPCTRIPAAGAGASFPSITAAILAVAAAQMLPGRAWGGRGPPPAKHSGASGSQTL